MSELILAVDQGTSASKAIVVDRSGTVLSTGVAELSEQHPAPGWVEQSPEHVWSSVREAVAEAVAAHDPKRFASVGLSTQRESVLLWERATGRPLGPVLSWQDQRTAPEAEEMLASEVAPVIRSISGLPVDPMFSALKARWLLDHYDPDRERSRRGELCLGTVDSWLLYRMSGRHVVEIGNAARTQLFDVTRHRWSPELLAAFGVPRGVLPGVLPSTGRFATAANLHAGLDGVPVSAVLGDSHAALFAHAGWRPGTVKVTYGTGSSVMGLAPHDAAPSGGLCRTIAWQVDEPAHAVEGNIRATGATLNWLAQLLGTTPAEVADLAAEDSEGVHIVPAFNGLGAPWWDGGATGLVTGLTFSSGPPQIARAALESIAFQVEDVVSEVDTEGAAVRRLLADGGPTGNAALMRLQADTSGRTVVRTGNRSLSALGAAHLAGLAAGVWRWADLENLPREQDVYQPREATDSRRRRRRAWHQAVRRARYRPPGEGTDNELP